MVQIEIVSSSLSRSSSTGIHGPPRSVLISDRKMIGSTRRCVIPWTSGRSRRWSSHDPTIKSQLKLSDFDGIRSFWSQNYYKGKIIYEVIKLTFKFDLLRVKSLMALLRLLWNSSLTKAIMDFDWVVKFTIMSSLRSCEVCDLGKVYDDDWKDTISAESLRSRLKVYDH